MNIDDQTRLAVLKDILAGTELVIGEDGASYATIMRDDIQVTYPTFSRDFMIWLSGEAVQRLSSVPSTKIMKQAIGQAEYEARLLNLTIAVASRFYADKTTALINLGNGEVLEIGLNGSATTEDTGIIFPARPSMECLPKPEDGDVLAVLPELLDLPEDQCRLALIWLMSLFQPDGRYLVLVITGPRQSGKTRLATNLRQLLDPHPVPLLPPPKNYDELKAAVLDNAILAFDNVEKVPLEEELLALAAGTALTFPGWSRPVRCRRPAIIVCKDIPDAPDLLENAIVLRLKERPARSFKSKSELDSMFYRQHGKALGSLAKACTMAMQHRKTIELDAVHKDAELEKWILAIDKGLGLGGKMQAALQHNLEQTLTAIVRDRPAIVAFLALVKAKGSVKATATELLAEIEPFLEAPKDARYPTSGKAFAKLLRDHKRFMTDIDIEFDVRTGKDRDRNIVATWQSHRISTDTPAASQSRPETAVKPKASGKVGAKPVKDAAKSHDQPSLL